MTAIPLPPPPLAATPSRSDRRARRRASRHVLAWFAAFVVLSVVSWLYQQFDFAGSLDHGIPIPDVVNMARAIDNLQALGGGDQEGNQFIGVSLLYGWTWIVHPSLCFVVNAILMAWATRVYSDFFVGKLQVPAWSIIGLLGNPYLILAMIGPNKEIPLALATLLYFRTLVEKRPGWPLVAVALSGVVYLFRDGYGAFLLLSTVLFVLFRLRARPYALLMCAGCAALAALFGVLDSFIPILSRNIQSFEAIAADNLAVGAFAAALGLDPFSPLGGLVTFGLRLAYNLLSLAFFPVFQTTGGIYWMGVGFWINGMMLLTCVPACVANLLKQAARPPLMLCAAFMVATWFMVSVSLFVQPRYLLPALPMAMAAFACSSRKIRVRSVQAALALSAFIIVGYWLLDRAPPLADPDSFAPPAYILQS